MSRKIKFHLDENANSAIAKGLRRRIIDVTTTGEEGLIAVSDEEQLAFSLLEKRVLFTQDDDFLKFHNAGVAHEGIVYCKKDSRSMGEIIQTLYLLWECVTPDEMTQRVEFR